MLHAIAERLGVSLLTLDASPEWLERFRARFEAPWHEFRLVEDWSAELAQPLWEERWHLVFVDQSPFEARAATVERVRLSADYVVVHDCDYFPENDLFGTAVRPLLGTDDRGERDYGDVFSSWREFFPAEPWPHGRTGPPTLLGSNRYDVTRFDIDYDRHLPLWWKLGRRTRRIMPAQMRMRVANLAGWGRS